MLNDALIRDLATRQQAIDHQNALAAQNIGLNSGLMSQIYGFGTGMAKMPNENLMTALGSVDQMAMLNTQLQNQIALENAKLQAAQMQAAQQGRAGAMGGLGALVGTGLGALLAVPTGGMSVLAGAQLGGALGGAGGSALGGFMK